MVGNATASCDSAPYQTSAAVEHREAEIERCFQVRMTAIHAASILRPAEALLRVGGDVVDAERARMIASGLMTRQIDFVKVEEDAA